jgi:hypothetical protein
MKECNIIAEGKALTVVSTIRCQMTAIEESG